MARICEVCKKGSLPAGRYQKLISRYNPRERKKQKVNLQWFRLGEKRILICNRCRKTLKKKLKGLLEGKKDSLEGSKVT